MRSSSVAHVCVALVVSLLAGSCTDAKLERVPAERVLAVEAATGGKVPRWMIRPDILAQTE